MKQQQVMVMQPNQAMVAYGEVPVLENRNRFNFDYTAETMNYLRCGCPAVQIMYHNSQESDQTKLVENIKAGLKRLYLPGESTNLEITVQDKKGLVILISHQVQLKKS